MKALLVYPEFAKSYYGYEYTHALTGKDTCFVPLGLITAAAMLPDSWELRLIDTCVEPLDDAVLRWADIVLISAMRIQRQSFHEIVARAHAFGKTVVAGGSYVTTDPDAASEVDHIVLGEAEDVLPELARQLETGSAPKISESSAFPDVTQSPLPRFDLLRLERYNVMMVQFSRGCPFNCEFCDIIEVFGRVPRAKAIDQFLRELEALADEGFVGPLFVADDNFIGHKKRARELCEALPAWNEAHGYPFDYLTAATVNLASMDALTKGMVDSGFTAVFLGIESPSEESLRETQKTQNIIDLDAACEKLTRAGLEVMAGFIVGFDGDDESCFDLQHDFITRAGIPRAMIGILQALPGTQLSRRLEREGRLYEESMAAENTPGDNVGHRSNFATTMPETKLMSGYAGLIKRLYAPRPYFDRCLRMLELQHDVPLSRCQMPWSFKLPTFVRSLWIQGVTSSYRYEYWRFLWLVLVRETRQFARAMAYACIGHHMIRYTRDVLEEIAKPALPRKLLPAVAAESQVVVKLKKQPHRAAHHAPEQQASV